MVYNDCQIWIPRHSQEYIDAVRVAGGEYKVVHAVPIEICWHNRVKACSGAIDDCRFKGPCAIASQDVQAEAPLVGGQDIRNTVTVDISHSQACKVEGDDGV